MPGSRIPSFRPIQGKCKHYTLLWPVESIPMVLHWSGSRTESRGGIKARWHDWETKRIIAAEWCKRRWEDGGVHWSKWCHQNFWKIAHHFDSHIQFSTTVLVLCHRPTGAITDPYTLSDLYSSATYKTLYIVILLSSFRPPLVEALTPGWKDTN